MIDYDSVGRKINMIRKLRGITQEKLAEMMDVQQYQISLLVNAKKGSGIDNLQKLYNACRCLDINLQDLLFMEECEFMEKYQPDESDDMMEPDEEDMIATMQQIEEEYNKDIELEKRIHEIENTDEFINIEKCIDRYVKFGHSCGLKLQYGIYKKSNEPHLFGVARESYRESLESYFRFEPTDSIKDRIQELQVLATKEQQELKIQIDDEEVDDEFEYCMLNYSILDRRDLKYIKLYLYEQKLDAENYFLADIPWNSEDFEEASLIFDSTPESGLKKTFEIYYNKNNHVCEPCYDYLKNTKDEFGVWSDSTNSLADAVNKSLYYDEETMEIADWAHNRGIYAEKITEIEMKEIRKDYSLYMENNK